MGYSGSSYSSDGPSGWWVVGGLFGAVVAVWAIVLIISLVSARATPQAGEIGVVRSGPSMVWVGDWFNGRGIHSVIESGSGSTGIGLGSSVHWYPADSVQRNYTITSDSSRGDRPGVDVVEVPTSDSVRVGLEGTFYFTTAFNNGAAGNKLVRDFDNRFGVRTFNVVGKGDELHPYEGTDGWLAFLDTVIRPIIDNDLRRSISGVSCAELVSSCALVHQQTQAALRAGGGTNSAEIQKIQDQINANLQQDIKDTLGQDYFSDVRFLLAKVTLPDAIQQQIDNAQAQYAAVATSAAKVQQAQQDAQANKLRERGYRDCPACATIDEFKSLPAQITTLALGSGSNIAVK